MLLNTRFFVSYFDYRNALAGVPGFEPGNAGIKTRCLTAWRHPIDSRKSPEEGAILSVFGKVSNLVIKRSKIIIKAGVFSGRSIH